MRKLKAFLSKSKAGSISTGLLTKKLLLDAGMEVVEYDDGNYSPDLMLSCDILVIVPARTKSYYDNKYCSIGTTYIDNSTNPSYTVEKQDFSRQSDYIFYGEPGCLMYDSKWAEIVTATTIIDTSSSMYGDKNPRCEVVMKEVYLKTKPMLACYARIKR